MTSIDRMNCLLAGEAPDRTPFVPSIYEHGARLIEEEPAEVSRDPDLMARAAVESYATYGHDIVTVGIDIYNIEPEAFGCKISEGRDGAIPGVLSHPLAEQTRLDPARIEVPRPGKSNRLNLITDAVRQVVETIGSEVWVYACMCGPFSQAAELRGFEQLIVDIHEWPEAVHALMQKTTGLSTEQALRLSKHGCGVYVYESWATIPLITPDIFRRFVVPYNRQVVSAVREAFQTPPPAVIMGGDISILIDFFLEVDTSLIAVDYNADFDWIRRRIGQDGPILRGCVDPKLLERGDWRSLQQSVESLAEKAQGMTNFVWGCGCVSYDTPPEHVLRFKQMCLKAEPLRSGEQHG